MSRRLRLHNARQAEYPALIVNRSLIDYARAVYFITQNRPWRYRGGFSSIIYIGMTSVGIDRFLASLSDRLRDGFENRGVQRIELHVVSCSPRKNVRTWEKLERAFIIAFRERYGEIPLLNVQGRGMTATDEYEYFSRAEIEGHLAVFDKSRFANRPPSIGSAADSTPFARVDDTPPAFVGLEGLAKADSSQLGRGFDLSIANEGAEKRIRIRSDEVGNFMSIMPALQEAMEGSIDRSTEGMLMEILERLPRLADYEGRVRRLLRSDPKLVRIYT